MVRGQPLKTFGQRMAGIKTLGKIIFTGIGVYILVPFCKYEQIIGQSTWFLYQNIYNNVNQIDNL